MYAHTFCAITKTLTASAQRTDFGVAGYFVEGNIFAFTCAFNGMVACVECAMIVERSLSLAGIVHGNLMHKPTGITNWQHLLYERAHAMLAFVFCVRQRFDNGCTPERAVVFELMGDTDPLIRLECDVYGMPYLITRFFRLLLRIRWVTWFIDVVQ
jgi:hypothetical protein